jgi:drug/metabolite transporter (DMT)-like permease
MERIASPRIVAVAFAAIYFLWGGTYLAIALGLQSISPFLLIGSRSLLGGAALFVYSLWRGSSLRPWRDWKHAAISGAMLFLGCHGALAYAQRVVPSGLAAVVLATIPYWMVLINRAIGQKETIGKIVALIPGFFGVAVIAWREAVDGSRPVSLLMIAQLLGASISWALGSIYAQRRATHVPAEDLAGMQLLCGGVVLLVVSALAGEWTGLSLQRVTLVSWAGLLYLGLLGSALGNTAYIWLLDRYSAPVVATYTFVNPAIAVILGVIVLGEHVTSLTLAGSALVLFSVAMLLYLSYGARPVHSKPVDSLCIEAGQGGCRRLRPAIARLKRKREVGMCPKVK